METEVPNNKEFLGWSLPVDNVQELSSRRLRDIPDRYIRPEIKQDEVSTDGLSQIPVIDMSKLETGNLEREIEMEKLHQACKEWGFFQLTNHGAAAKIENMKVVVEEFFKLPLEQKMACAQMPNSIEGYGQAFVVSEDQNLDWLDMFLLFSLPISRRNMRLWPTVPTFFRSTFHEYSVELNDICLSLYKFMAINLGVDFEKFSPMYQESYQSTRMNYYPPCLQADKVIGLSPHSDASGLTLLVQINEVEGLQVKKNSKWVAVKPIPGAIIVNIGDAMEIFTNGEYSSPVHRAMVNFQKERYQ